MRLPTMSGDFGNENLRHYYADVFIPGIPADTTSDPIARSVGDSLLVDEFIMRVTMTETRRSCCRDWRRPAKRWKYQLSSL